MIRKAALLALLTALALAPGAALRAQGTARPANDTLSPGYWKVKASVLLFINDTDYQCLGTQAEADKFLNDGPCKKRTICKYESNNVGNGKVKYIGYWQDQDGERTNIRAEGTYTAHKLTLNARVGNIPPGTITATWQGETCPPGAKH